MADRNRPTVGQPLTDREHEILGLIAEGQSNPAIGKKLWVTEDTVKTHTRRMFAKLGAQNRAHAVALGYQRGLLHTPDGGPERGPTPVR